MKAIIDAIICDGESIPYELLIKKTRKGEIVLARQICMYFMKEMTSLSFSKIGELYGNKNHATVGHSVKTIQDYCDTNRVFDIKIQSYRKKIKMNETAAVPAIDMIGAMLKPMRTQIDSIHAQLNEAELQYHKLIKIMGFINE